MPARGRWRWSRCKWPIITLIVAGLAICGVRTAAIPFGAHITAAIVVFASLLLALWAILFTGLTFVWRLGLLGTLMAAILGAGFVVKKFTRVEGSWSGGGLPRLVWNWSPPRDSQLPPVIPVVSESAADSETASFSFPEFLGPGRTNFVHVAGLASDWASRPPQELWRREVGAGWSGFAVAKGRAVTQEQRGAQELVVCYRLLNGQILWAHTNQVRFSEELGGAGPRATPTIDRDWVFTMGATGILDCLDLASGRLIWSRETLKRPGIDNLTWGKSNSPLIVDNQVIVTGGGIGALLLAFQRETGAAAWEAGLGSASYASPVLATLAGHRQLLIVNAQTVTGHDPTNGKLLWRYDWPGSLPKVSQPVAVAPNKVFISAGYGIGSVLLQLSSGSDNGPLNVSEVWRSRSMKTKFTNVAIREGFVYGLDEGILECIELATGNRRWKDGRYGHGQLLLVGDVLLVQMESGSVALVAANPTEQRELARWPALTSKTWNNPALAGPYLLLRNDREALCLKLATSP